jgi:hypothetical protein
MEYKRRVSDQPGYKNTYIEKLCDEKHRNIDEGLKDIKESINDISKKLNWFYILVIGTLISALSAVVMSCVK